MRWSLHYTGLEALKGLACLCLLLASSNGWAMAEGAPDCPPDGLRPLAPNVWVWAGANEDANFTNQGHVTTTVVLVRPATQNGRPTTVTVIDPGPSRQHGHALLTALNCRWGTAPAQVINTHAHAENVLATSALTADNPGLPVLATPTTTQTMDERCPDCLKSLTQKAGEAAMKGTTIALPNTPLHTGVSLPLTDQAWHVHEALNAHTRSDLILWQANTRTLVAGGLVYQQRLPELAQGSLLGWLHTLATLQQWPTEVVIGTQPGTRQDITDTHAYLCDLATAVWQAMDQGLAPGEAENIALHRYAHWADYAKRQSFNAQRAWRELESRWMAGESAPCSMPNVGR